MWQYLFCWLPVSLNERLNLWQQGRIHFENSASLKEISQEIIEINHWGIPEIEAYFEENDLHIEEITNDTDIMNALKELNPEPLKALIPLIAREIVLSKQAILIRIAPYPTSME